MSKIIRHNEIEGRKDLSDLLVADDSVFVDASEGKVMTSGEMTARQEAQRMIEEAKVESQRIRERARLLLEQVENERAAARVRGHEEGYQQGMAEATELIVATKALEARIVSEAEPKLVQLALAAVKKVIGQAAREGVVRDVVREALAVAVGQALVIRIHPDDRPIVESSPCLAQVRARLGATLQIKVDADMTRGGCIIESEVGTVDARLEVQLAALEKAFASLEGAPDV